MTASTTIPEALMQLRDRITESLPPATAPEWSDRFGRLIAVGADLSPVIPQFLRWLLSDEGPMSTNADIDVVSTVRSLYDRVLRGEDVSSSEWKSAKEAAEYTATIDGEVGMRFAEVEVAVFAAMRNAAEAAEEAAEIPKTEALNEYIRAQIDGLAAAEAAKEAASKAAKAEDWEAFREWCAYYDRIDGEALEKNANREPDHDWIDKETMEEDAYREGEEETSGFDDIDEDPRYDSRAVAVAATAAAIRAQGEATRYTESIANATRSVERSDDATAANWRGIAERLLEIITECTLDSDA